MKLSRRGMLGALLAAAPIAAIAKPAFEPAPVIEPKQTFAKGMIVPRYHMAADHSHGYSACHTHNLSPAAASYTHGYSAAQAVVTDYEIFDGEKFVAFNSAAGQQVMRDLS